MFPDDCGKDLPMLNEGAVPGGWMNVNYIRLTETWCQNMILLPGRERERESRGAQTSTISQPGRGIKIPRQRYQVFWFMPGRHVGRCWPKLVRCPPCFTGWWEPTSASYHLGTSGGKRIHGLSLTAVVWTAELRLPTPLIRRTIALVPLLRLGT